MSHDGWYGNNLNSQRLCQRQRTRICRGTSCVLLTIPQLQEWSASIPSKGNTHNDIPPTKPHILKAPIPTYQQHCYPHIPKSWNPKKIHGNHSKGLSTLDIFCPQPLRSPSQPHFLGWHLLPSPPHTDPFNLPWFVEHFFLLLL